ncbi:MAG: hypothetical protein J6S67_19840 [Methanobrevibacter sp.]|nr:hypothetical protein [Methanobrevibacter sp.]
MEKFDMIENYIYLYHTKTFIIIPQYPESIADSMSATFASTTPLSRSAPIYAYSNSGPRTLQISLSLHRDMMTAVNLKKSNVVLEIGDDYVDTLIKQIQAVALPSYEAAQKMVSPPIVAVRFGNDIFCKGIVNGGVTVTYKTPIIADNKYALVDISFNISEIDPYDANTVMQSGSFRGLNTTLESRLFKKSPTGLSTAIR